MRSNNNTENDFYIINDKSHWTSIVFKEGEWKEIDSFNRDLIENMDEEKLPLIQKDKQSDCGQRTLTMLKLIVS